MLPAPTHCPVCAAAIGPEAVDAALAIARCGSCRSVLDLADRAPTVGAPRLPQRPQVPLPARFRVESSGPRSLAVSWRWFSAKHVIFAVLSVMFIGFALLWGLIMSLVGEVAAGMGWSSIQVLVGAVAGYAAVAGFFNTTRIEASRDRLALTHGPLPWRGNLVISRDDLTQLFAREDRSRDENGVSVSYELRALDRAGRSKVLLAGLGKLEEALWLEQQIEWAMAIEDFPVAGEVAKRSA